MSDRDRENTAVHESGHAAVSFRLFRRCGVVSIEPNEHWRGVTLFGRPELKLLTDREGPSTFNRPAYLLSAPVRRKLEYAGMVYLGGPLAAQFMIPSARFGIDACEEAAMEVAEVLAGPPQLTSKEVAMLEAAK